MESMVLCPNCFQKGSYVRGVCESCGYVQEERPAYALPEGYVLAKKYAIGRVLEQDEVMITYLVQDLETEVIQTIREYFPAAWVNRAADGVHVKLAVSEKEEAFRYGLDVFENENKILAALGEDTIVARTKDFLKKNDTAYAVSERIDGETLAKHMQTVGKPYSVEEAGRLIRKIALEIKDLHALGLLHRYIGPDCARITADGAVAMVDFEATKQYVLGEVHGLQESLKVGFAPSEQYAGTDGQGTWTDVYALAATYYYMVTGKLPVSAVERSKGALQPSAQMQNKAVPDRVSAVIDKAMAVMYWERCQTMDQFIQELNEAEGVQELHPYLRLKVGTQMRQWKVEEDRDIRVGRYKSDCEICVEGDSVSRHHCTIHYDSRRNIFLVKDVSANGTFTARGLVGRGRVAEVAPGERIYLVSNKYELYLEVK